MTKKTAHAAPQKLYPMVAQQSLPPSSGRKGWTERGASFEATAQERRDFLRAKRAVDKPNPPKPAPESAHKSGGKEGDL